MIVITGGTGTSGRPIVEAVAKAAGAGNVRVMVRDVARAAELKALGVELVKGDLGDAEAVERCCAGADVMFLNSGPAEDLVELQTTAVRGARAAGVRRIVKLSVWGAESARLRDAMRFMKQHAEVEEAVVKSGMAWTMLRPTFFMSNLLGSAGTIKAQGAIYMPAGEGKAAYVDGRDIADVAAAVMTKPGHEGKAYALTGPEDLSLHDMAREIGRASGKDVKYVPVSEEAARASLLGAGVPAFQVEGVLELMRGTREGWMAGVSPDVETVLGHKGRTFAAWARENRGAFV